MSAAYRQRLFLDDEGLASAEGAIYDLDGRSGSSVHAELTVCDGYDTITLVHFPGENGARSLATLRDLISDLLAQLPPFHQEEPS